MNKNKKHWLVVAILCGFTACFSIPINLSGVFLSPVATDLGFQRGDFSFHATLTLFICAISSLCVPHLMEKFRLKYILIVAAVLSGVPNIMMGFAQHLWEFNLWGGIRGIGVGLISTVPVAIILNHWFHKYHGVVMSLVLSFSGVTGAVVTPIFTQFIFQFGWRNTYFISGAFMILLLLPGILIPFKINPVLEGLEPLGMGEVHSKDSVTHASHVSKNVFNRKMFIAVTVVAILHTAITGLGQHLPGFSESTGYSSEIGAMMLAVAMIGNIFFKLSVGAISDRLNAVVANLLMIACGLFSVILFMIQTGPTLLFVGAFFFGATLAIPTVGISLLTKELLGNVYFNKVFPLISFGLATSGALSISLVGYLFDLSGSYTPALLLTAGINILTILLLLMMTVKTKKEVTGETLSL